MIEKVKRVLMTVDIPSETPPDNSAIISNANDIVVNCALPLVDLALIQRNSASLTLTNGDVILAAGVSPLDGENKYWRVSPASEGYIYSCLINNSGVISMISICA
jgi:hypothetical protein